MFYSFAWGAGCFTLWVIYVGFVGRTLNGVSLFHFVGLLYF